MPELERSPTDELHVVVMLKDIRRTLRLESSARIERYLSTPDLRGLERVAAAGKVHEIAIGGDGRVSTAVPIDGSSTGARLGPRGYRSV